MHSFLYEGHFHPDSPRRVRRHFIRGLFPSLTPAYTPSFYTGSVYIPLLSRVYAIILYGDHFHLDSSPRIRRHFIRGSFPSRFSPAYTSSFYTGTVSIQIPPAYTLSFYT